MPVLTFIHNPYAFNVLAETKQVPTHPPQDEDEKIAMEVALSGLSDGDNSDDDEEVWVREDSKLNLGGQIPFFKYDPFFRSANEDVVPLSACVRLFAGQLPYQMPPSAVMWLLWVVTGVHAVRVEKIIRWKNNRQPCGCFHVYCLPRDEAVVLGANELALIDGDGVWVAESAGQVTELRDFCRTLATTKDMRATGMPYQLVTLQPARSTYARTGPRQDERAAYSSVAYFVRRQ